MNCVREQSVMAAALCYRAWGATRATRARTTTPASMEEFASAPTAALSASAAILTTRALSARRVSTNAKQDWMTVRINNVHLCINTQPRTHARMTNWNANHYSGGAERTWLARINSLCEKSISDDVKTKQVGMRKLVLNSKNFYTQLFHCYSNGVYFFICCCVEIFNYHKGYKLFWSIFKLLDRDVYCD